MNKCKYWHEYKCEDFRLGTSYLFRDRFVISPTKPSCGGMIVGRQSCLPKIQGGDSETDMWQMQKAENQWQSDVANWKKKCIDLIKNYLYTGFVIEKNFLSDF